MLRSCQPIHSRFSSTSFNQHIRHSNMSSDNEARETGISEGESQSSIIDSITWDDFHDSPQAEIVLVSKDMVGFRVYAWYMRKKRSV